MGYNRHSEDDFEEADESPDGARYTFARRNRQRPRAGRPGQRGEREEEEEQPTARPAVKRQRPNTPEEFRCRHCRLMVGLVPSGGRHRNHCPYCLHSRHVDLRTPGDRLSPCGGTMAPIGAFTQVNGEVSLIHRCVACGVERRNRLAADDDYDLAISLPDMTHWAPAQQNTLGAEDATGA
jgi:hypothetical protein